MLLVRYCANPSVYTRKPDDARGVVPSSRYVTLDDNSINTNSINNPNNSQSSSSAEASFLEEVQDPPYRVRESSRQNNHHPSRFREKISSSSSQSMSMSMALSCRRELSFRRPQEPLFSIRNRGDNSPYTDNNSKSHLAPAAAHCGRTTTPLFVLRSNENHRSPWDQDIALQQQGFHVRERTGLKRRSFNSTVPSSRYHQRSSVNKIDPGIDQRYLHEESRSQSSRNDGSSSWSSDNDRSEERFVHDDESSRSPICYSVDDMGYPSRRHRFHHEGGYSQIAESGASNKYMQEAHLVERRQSKTRDQQWRRPKSGHSQSSDTRKNRLSFYYGHDDCYDVPLTPKTRYWSPDQNFGAKNDGLQKQSSANRKIHNQPEVDADIVLNVSRFYMHSSYNYCRTGHNADLHLSMMSEATSITNEHRLTQLGVHPELIPSEKRQDLNEGLCVDTASALECKREHVLLPRHCIENMASKIFKSRRSPIESVWRDDEDSSHGFAYPVPQLHCPRDRSQRESTADFSDSQEPSELTTSGLCEFEHELVIPVTPSPSKSESTQAYFYSTRDFLDESVHRPKTTHSSSIDDDTLSPAPSPPIYSSYQYDKKETKRQTRLDHRVVTRQEREFGFSDSASVYEASLQKRRLSSFEFLESPSTLASKASFLESERRSFVSQHDSAGTKDLPSKELRVDTGQPNRGDGGSPWDSETQSSCVRSCLPILSRDIRFPTPSSGKRYVCLVESPQTKRVISTPKTSSPDTMYSLQDYYGTGVQLDL